MSELFERVGRTLSRRHLFKKGEAILVAVSGGLDSMVLLDTLQGLAGPYDWKLVVAHFNHRWRGRESDGDERFVQRAATRWGLEFVCERWARSPLDPTRKHGDEMAARLARHDFLARAARERNIRTIALAHHADDQAELFFLRLFRGAGGEGLAGMKWEGPGIIPVPRELPLRLVRPFLDRSREELERHASHRHLRFREDSSNSSRRHLRNRIRHELLPRLVRHFEPAIVRMVTRTMDLAGTDADFARREAERWLARPGAMPFDQLHPAVQRQGLRLQLARLQVAATYELVEALRLQADRAVSIEAQGALSRDVSGRVARLPGATAEFNPLEIQIDLGGGRGRCSFAAVELAWRVMKGAESPRRPAARAGREYFDAGAVGRMVTLRHWREGDRFQPIGMSREVKLQDLFTNLKIPRARRHELLVATTSDGGIWWVEQMRIGDRFKLGRWTKRRLGWRWRRSDPSPTGVGPVFGR